MQKPFQQKPFQQKSLQTKAPRIAAALLAAAGLSFLSAPATAQPAPVDPTQYSVTTFGQAPSGATNPDSIAISGSDVFVGYGNNAGVAGGGTSTIAEFSSTGALLNQFSVSGHNDGLKVAPDGSLWSLQNEDGNPNLAIFNTSTGTQQDYTLTPVNGGGYDDVAFVNGNAYISASNALLNPNTAPAIVQATLANGAFTFTPILEGNALANGGTAQLDLIDADSLTTTPNGSLFLTDQTKNQVITVSNQGTPYQVVSALGTSYNGVSTDVDDTVFPGGKAGTLLVSDTNSNNIYAIHGPFDGSAYSAGPDVGIVASLDTTTGALTPIVTGFTAPKGMGFLPSAPVPEASTTVSFGLLLMLGLGSAVVAARKKRVQASA